MLTFLRKIRRSLIESGSTRKYLFYAIGEISLVVIGILIALQINNWNEGMKDRRNEQVLLISLLNEFEGVTNELLRAYNVHGRRIDAIESIINYMDAETELPEADSLWNLISAAHRPTSIDPPAGILSSSFASGDIALIDNEPLHLALTSWREKIVDHQRTEDNVRNYINSILLAWIAEKSIYPELAGPTLKWKQEISQNFKSKTYRNHLLYLHFQSGICIDESVMLSEEVERIKDLLITNIQ